MRSGTKSSPALFSAANSRTWESNSVTFDTLRWAEFSLLPSFTRNDASATSETRLFVHIQRVHSLSCDNHVTIHLRIQSSSFTFKNPSRRINLPPVLQQTSIKAILPHVTWLKSRLVSVAVTLPGSMFVSRPNLQHCRSSWGLLGSRFTGKSRKWGTASYPGHIFLLLHILKSYTRLVIFPSLNFAVYGNEILASCVDIIFLPRV